jgi:AdoMet-dependent rRNA methyltransferase SPB1
MPTGGLIVAVDLSPIKPIPRVISLQSDITTDKCRAMIGSHFKHLKADTVLHDGAPNVGAAWIQDAFSQAELVLQSLKLASEFLKEGGTFVTKVFRSKDYNPLLWVFKQLFTSVEATKPPSSRTVSAEIFVVCRGFKAPKRLDPKFLDPKHVFAELSDPNPNNESKVFNPEKKKRKRDGYEEGDWTQHKEIAVIEFINTTDPIAILGSYHKLSFQQPPSGDLALATLDRLEETTDEIRTCCEDLRVLGKREFRNLLRWRIRVREKFGLAVKKGQAQETDAKEVAEIRPMDDELAVQEELQRLRERSDARKKKERRKDNTRKQKEIIRMQMHMITPVEIGMEQSGPIGEDAMFAMKPVTREHMANAIASGKSATVESDDQSDDLGSSEDETDDEEDRLERELDAMYEQYQGHKEDRDSKLRAKKARKDYEAGSWDGLSNSDQDTESNASDDSDGNSNSASAPAGPPAASGHLSNKAAIFFDQDIFQGLGDIQNAENEDSAIEMEDDHGINGTKPQMSQEASLQEKVYNPKLQVISTQTRDFGQEYIEKEKEEDAEGRATEPQYSEDPRRKDGRLGEVIVNVPLVHFYE